MKQENQSDKVVKTPQAPKPLPGKSTGTSVAKTPLRADEEGSSESSDSEEDTAEKVLYPLKNCITLSWLCNALTYSRFTFVEY